MLPGDEYIQYSIPRGEVRRELINRGVRFVRVGEVTLELAKITKGGSVCVKV